MIQRGSLIFLGIFLCVSGFASASSNHTIELDGTRYTFSLVSVEGNYATINVNGELKEIGPAKSSPYLFKTFSSSKPFSYIVKSVSSSSGDTGTIQLYVMEQKTLVQGASKIYSLDGTTYSISLIPINSTNFLLSINNNQINVGPLQTEPPYVVSSFGQGYPGAAYVINSYMYASKDTQINSSLQYLGFEISLSNACEEDWSCSPYGECILGKRGRTCVDNNSCGTNESKPRELQSCTEASTIECSSDNDCGATTNSNPICEGNNRCIKTELHQCINPGTQNSYCKTSSENNCAYCDRGCYNGQCLTNSLDGCTVGSRDFDKYCSLEKSWVSQKEDGSYCSNGFECLSNICTKGECGEKSSNALKYGLIGIAFVILLLVIYLTRRKN